MSGSTSLWGDRAGDDIDIEDTDIANGETEALTVRMDESPPHTVTLTHTPYVLVCLISIITPIP